MRDFSEGSQSGFAELPVPAAWMKWTRGDAKLAQIKDADPGAYFGGFRAFLTHKDRNSNEQVENPRLPIPVVQRVSEDGKHVYQVYATNSLNFLPIQFRLRYEYREKTHNDQTGKDEEKVLSSSPVRKDGYQPSKQIFGLVFSDTSDEYAPAILYITNWSSFISMNKAAEQWKKVKVPADHVLIRRYGSIGVKDAKGIVMPKFEIFGQGRSTPIDAIDTAHPRFFKAIPEFDDLFDGSLAWKNCERWNADGKVTEELPETNPYLEKFDELCKSMGLTNIEIEQIMKEAGNSYKKAVEILGGGEWDENDINAALSQSDQEM